MDWLKAMQSVKDALGRKITWKHLLTGTVVTVGMNVGILGALFGAYRWTYADYLEAMKKFKETHGRTPPEKHRLEAFAYYAEKYDKAMGRHEETGADLYREQLLIKSRGDVLEVAVGTGRCFGALTKSGLIKSYVGVDKVKEMIDVAQKKLQDLPFEARVLQADAAALPFPDKSFDT
eukprot:2448662-Amphidinium_carterae.1